MDKSNRVLIYVDSLNRAKFFLPFKEFFEVVFITNKLSSYIYLKKRACKVFLIKKSKTILDIDYSNSLSILNQYHTLKEAKNIGGSVINLLEKIGDFNYFFIWNGTTTIERVLSYYAKKNSIKTRYFEISNIENRVFVDKEGVLVESFLYKNPNLLDNFDIDEKEFNSWREEYKKKKKIKRAIKSEIPYQNLIDFFGYLIGIEKEDRRNYLKLLLRRVKNKKVKLPLKNPDFSKDYIFTPLQVSNDSQVKLFSKYSNIDLIKEAIKIAKDKNCYLYIKPHPQEDNMDELNRIFSFESEKVKFVNGDLFDLILNSKMVIVNNSTVGLEAKIFDKEVLVYGEAYYKSFDKRRLISFIQDYLSNMTYPENSLDKEKIKHLIKGIDL